MRILIAHEALAGAGGVESYLSCLVPALLARGHRVAFLHHNPASEPGPTSLQHADVRTFGVADQGLAGALAGARAWQPQVCFSHNMRDLDIETALAGAFPMVKMMHGYFGTCIGGQKAHGFPAVTACSRRFGPKCLALYLPRQCGQRHPMVMLNGYAWASRQRKLFASYAHVVVASEHMGDEYRRNGVPAERLTVAPLFPTAPATDVPRGLPDHPRVLFAGRMTRLKGGDVLVRAIAAAAARLHRPVHVTLAGEGPEKHAWQSLALRVGVTASFPGWVSGPDLTSLMREASVLAVPSLWPEPFGLVGLEAGLHGVPAVAFDAGGIREWLEDDINGRLVRQVGDAAALGAAIASVAGDPTVAARLGEGARRVAVRLSLDAHVGCVEAILSRAARS